jgi:beta-glucuronidase
MAGANATPVNSSSDSAAPGCDQRVTLNGDWLFRLDPARAGEPDGWFRSEHATTDWRTVAVPHTWQIEPENTEYRGIAWYRRNFDAHANWADLAVRLEFEAVFHSAAVWLNGLEVGRRTGKGYTAFTLDLNSHLRPGAVNTLVVQVDNAFNNSMLPRGKSSDWANDGGIYRPVQLLVTPRTFIERVRVEAEPDLVSGSVAIEVSADLRNVSDQNWEGTARFQVVDEPTGLTVADSAPMPIAIAPGGSRTVSFPATSLTSVALWHFDHPHIYQLVAKLSNGDSYREQFGVRKIEVATGGFYLNGERVRLMGVERMAGSNPEFGMAEPTEWIAHDHADMKELNCVYTRVHWPQDRRVLDWCDRHGILIQTEVPTWGAATFAGMGPEPSSEIMNNGLEQLREMIERDRNHPCILSWGVCNEINGQNPPAYAFAKRMYEEAKHLDPRRPVSYASNSLHQTPEKDVAGLMDYVMWNEYFESWSSGTPADMARHLDDIHRAFPGKAIVISEYGYCACTANRPEGDAKRIDILREHDRVFRERPFVAGLIFFDYNDYRTHMGDRGIGALRQRVHGVVDVFGIKKPSWEVLRDESSPIESLRIAGRPGALRVDMRARGSVPSYHLRGYSVRGIAYGFGHTPVEELTVGLEVLAPGESAHAELSFTQPDISRIDVDVMRPTGFSARKETWRY